MPLSIYDDVLAEAINGTKDKDTITFSLFGGEPFLNFDLIEYMVSSFKQHDRLFNLSIVTNMTILTDHMLNFLLDPENQKYINIAVSLDGNKETHDKNRNNTFDLVLSNFNKLKDGGIHIGVSAVVDIDTLPNFFTNFLYLLSLGITSFSFFINFNNILFLEDKKYADALSFELEKICAYLRSSKKRIRVRIERLLLNEAPEREDILPCDGRVEYVDTDGNRFNCTRHKYANLKGKIEFKQYDKCSKCSVKAYCCSCFGNESFLYTNGKFNFTNFDEDKIDLYKQNYCYLMNKYVTVIMNHHKLIKNKVQVNELAELNGKLLIKNPTVINTTDTDIFISLEEVPNIEFLSQNDITAIIVIHQDNIKDILNIVSSLSTNIKEINFVFRSVHNFSPMDILMLENIIKDIARRGTKYNDIQDYSFVKNGKVYSDIDYTYDKTDNKNNLLCSNCNIKCPLDYSYNYDITGESIIPPENFCRIRNILYTHGLVK